MCQNEKVWETMQKSFQRKGSGPTQSFFDVLPASFRIPLIHLDLDLWLSPVWGEYFDLLKNRVLERWWGSKGSWQAVLAGCQPQRKFGVLLLLAPVVAPRWGLEGCALFLKSWIEGGIGSQNGKSGSHWKLWCHSQIRYCSQLGSPFDSWGLK